MSQRTHRPLALCAEHGLFETDALGFAPGVSVGFVGFSVICPRCSRTSPIVPGFYKGDNEKLELLLDPSVSSEMLEAFRRLANDVQTGRITPEAAEREAEKIHPKAAKLFNVPSWSDQAKATLYASIIGAIAVVTAAKISSSATQNVTVQPVIERVASLQNGGARLPNMGGVNAVAPPLSLEPSNLRKASDEESLRQSKRKRRRIAGKEKGSRTR